MNQVVKIEPAKRLTLARLVGKVENVKERTPLCEIAYHVNAITNTDNPDAPGETFPSFTGEFLGTNLKTGDRVSSGQATLPTILSKAIEAAKGDAAPNITGRSTLGVEPKEGGGLSYYVEHAIPPARRSVIDMLEDHHPAALAREAEAKAAAEKAKK